MSKVIGIDLGTTNSCVATIENGEPVVIPNAEGARTTPSVVGFTEKGDRLVGQPARHQQVTNPQNTVFSIKRFMGRRHSEVEHEEKLVPYEVIGGGEDLVKVNVRDKDYSPPEVSAMILRDLKKTAEDYLGEAVDRAVIRTEPKKEEQQQAPALKEEEASPAPEAASTEKKKKKKKKKKASYKDLMASMTSGTPTKDRDVEKERRDIQGLGGGNFSKLDKI